MNSVLLWIGGIIAVALAALFAVPHFIDWNLYRGAFEEEASRVLGQEVRVGGAVNLSLLPTPYVSFERVRIAQVPGPGETREPFLRAERFSIGLAVAPLLRGAVEASQVVLVKPEVQLHLDSSGRGNWQKLRFNPEALPVTPNEVALRGVLVTGGAISLKGPDGRLLTRIESMDGELAKAPGEGPFRFHGTLSWNGEMREVRLSTGDAGPDAVRVKAQMRSVDSAASYMFDGDVTSLSVRPRITGAWVARVPLRLGGSGGARISTPQADAAVPAGETMEVRAQVEGDGLGIRLGSLAVAFEQDGQPQLLEGLASASWGSGLALTAELGSRWLDLDRIAGTAGARPLDTVRWLAGAVTGAVPREGSFQGRVVIDQITLGGDIVSAGEIAVASQDGSTTLERLAAGLPGGGRIELSGNVRSGLLDGSLALRGTSAARMLAWAGKGFDLPQLPSDAAFSLRSAVLFGRDRFEWDKLEAEFGGRQLKSSGTSRWDERPTVSVALEAQRIDLGRLIPAILSHGLLSAFTGHSMPIGGEPSDVAGWFDPARTDLALRIKAGRLDDERAQLRDVDLDVSIRNRQVRIARAAFTTAAGAVVDVAGNLEPAAPERRAAAAWQVTAESPAAVRELLAMAELAAIPPGETLAGLLPLRMAGTIAPPAVSGGPTSVRIDGSLRETRVRGEVRVAAAQAQWADAMLDVSAEIAGADALKVLELVGRRSAGRGNDAPMRHAGRINLSLSGVPKDGLLMVGSLSALTGEMGFDGRIVLPKDGGVGLDGTVMIDAVDAAGLPLQAFLSTHFSRLAGMPIKGSIGVGLTADELTLSLRELEAGGSRVGGTIAFDRRHPERGFSADLAAGTISVGALLGALQSNGPEPPAGVEPRGSDIWSERPFDPGAFADLRGRLQLRADRLDIGGGLALTGARLDVELSPETIDVRELAGKALEGNVTSRWRLEPGRADIGLSGEMSIEGASIAAARQTPDARTQGTVDANLRLAGRGLSPRSLVQFATGGGELTLHKVQLAGLAPSAAQMVAAAVLSGDVPSTVDDVRSALRLALEQGAIRIGTIKLPIEVGNGALKVGALAVTAPEAAVENRTTLDLSTFQVDSEWRFRPKLAAAGAAKPPLPNVTVVYVGPAADLARRPPQLLADDLVRELTVRRMERDVDDLERLRRLDEERARREAERRRAQATERAAEGATSTAAAPARVIVAPLPVAPVTTAPSPIASPPPAAFGAPGSGSGPVSGFPADAKRWFEQQQLR